MVFDLAFIASSKTVTSFTDRQNKNLCHSVKIKYYQNDWRTLNRAKSLSGALVLKQSKNWRNTCKKLIYFLLL